MTKLVLLTGASGVGKDVVVKEILGRRDAICIDTVRHHALDPLRKLIVDDENKPLVNMESFGLHDRYRTHHSTGY